MVVQRRTEPEVQHCVFIVPLVPLEDDTVWSHSAKVVKTYLEMFKREVLPYYNLSSGGYRLQFRSLICIYFRAPSKF